MIGVLGFELGRYYMKANYKASRGGYVQLREAVQEAFDAVVDLSSSTNVQINCPACLSRVGKVDIKAKLAVNRESGFFRCFRCEFRGKLLGFTSWDYRDRPEVETSSVPKIQLPKDFEPFSEVENLSFMGQLVDYAIDRVHGRVEVLKEVGAGFCGGRLVVPIRDKDGEMRGWAGREIPGIRAAWLPGTKYVYPKGFRRDFVLFNEAALFVPPEEFHLGESAGIPVAFVEGVFDALPHWPAAVACLGKPTSRQVDSISQCRRPMVIIFDNDAWEEGKALADIMFMRGNEASWVQLPPEVDPGDLYHDEMVTILRQSSKTSGMGFKVSL